MRSIHQYNVMKTMIPALLLSNNYSNLELVDYKFIEFLSIHHMQKHIKTEIKQYRNSLYLHPYQKFIWDKLILTTKVN